VQWGLLCSRGRGAQKQCPIEICSQWHHPALQATAQHPIKESNANIYRGRQQFKNRHSAALTDLIRLLNNPLVKACQHQTPAEQCTSPHNPLQAAVRRLVLRLLQLVGAAAPFAVLYTALAEAQIAEHSNTPVLPELQVGAVTHTKHNFGAVMHTTNNIAPVLYLHLPCTHICISTMCPLGCRDVGCIHNACTWQQCIP